jgi:hypothetical protein
MLNYFLLQLAGPQRKSLTVKDPEKYEFKPKQLLKQVPYEAIYFFLRHFFFICCWLVGQFLSFSYCLSIVDCHHLCPYLKG